MDNCSISISPFSQAQLDELDRLAAQWIADDMRWAKTSKKP
jgi:hypothetical protein